MIFISIQVASLLLIHSINKNSFFSFCIALCIAPNIASVFIKQNYLFVDLSKIIYFTLMLNFTLLYFYIKIAKNITQPTSKYIEKHHSKSNIPTIGGGIFISIFILINLILIKYFPSNTYYEKPISELTGFAICIKQNYLILSLVFIFGLLGLYDDIKKIYYKNNKGISAKYKFIFQILISTILLVFFKPELSILKLIWWSFVIVSSVNAVNLTDGLDGLASYCSLSTILFLFIFNLYFFKLNLMNLIIMAATLLSFLQFNKYPAKIFMGDTGSMALGAFLAIHHLLIGKEWLFILTGLIFVIETLSSIIQIISIKLFNMRIFKKAPIHHHFEYYMHEKNVTKIMFATSIIVNLFCIYYFVK